MGNEDDFWRELKRTAPPIINHFVIALLIVFIFRCIGWIMEYLFSNHKEHFSNIEKAETSLMLTIPNAKPPALLEEY